MRQVRALSTVADVTTCGFGPTPPGAVAHHRIPDDRLIIPKTFRGLSALTLRQTERAYRNLPAATTARALLGSEDFDVLIANDIHALPAALAAARGRPVLADLHEYAPRESEEDWRWRLTLQRFNTDLCRWYLPRAAAVVTVSDSIAREYETNFGVTVGTILNAGPYRHPEPRPAGSPIRLVHTGVAGSNRKLDVMVEAAAGLSNVELDLYLVNPESRSRYKDELVNAAAQTPNVRVMDPVPMDQVPEVLDRYDVGVHILAPTSFNNLHALPNKLFDFVQSGLGVIVGPSPEMAALVHKHGLGRILAGFTTRDLREALAALSAEEVGTWKRHSCAAAWEMSGEAQARSLVELVLGLVR